MIGEQGGADVFGNPVIGGPAPKDETQAAEHRRLARLVHGAAEAFNEAARAAVQGGLLIKAWIYDAGTFTKPQPEVGTKVFREYPQEDDGEG